MIQFLNLPQIPQDIIEKLPRNFDQYHKKSHLAGGNYTWTDSFNQEINQWCQTHICSDIWFGFQYMTGDIQIHKDIGTQTKFVYVMETGGDNVFTNFYKDDQITLVKSYHIPAHTWHILQADMYHEVVGIVPGLTRFSVTGRIFGDQT